MRMSTVGGLGAPMKAGATGGMHLALMQIRRRFGCSRWQWGFEIIAADLLSGDPGEWRPGETRHTSPGLAMR